MGIPLLFQILVLLFAVTVHECAHGWMAYKCGDDTARNSGRLTLNPLAHIDLFGTIMLPLLLVMMHSSFLFAWAKPVPINPTNFNNPKNDIMKVGASGPVSNLLLAVASTVFIWLFQTMKMPATDANIMVQNMLVLSVYINLILAVFNLVPIPPLDGSQILTGLLTAKQQMLYEKISPFGMAIIILLMMSGFIDILIMPVVRFLQGILFWGLRSI
jgi:Zn-dependent protease